MTKNMQKPGARASRTQRLLDQLGGETGMLGPVVRAINKLMEDPILKQTMESLPNHDQKTH